MRWIRSISERMDNLLAKIERGEGTVGKLVSDEQMGNDLKETVASVKKAAGDASAVLGRIGEEARRTTGGAPIHPVTLTCPAGWGPTRRF